MLAQKKGRPLRAALKGESRDLIQRPPNEKRVVMPNSRGMVVEIGT
jgi:hypothetical protein